MRRVFFKTILFCWFQRNADDVSNFDKELTSQEAILTPPKHSRPIRDVDQIHFQGFNYVNQ